MLAAIIPFSILLAAAPVFVRADPDPKSPSPGDVFIQGQPCTTNWIADNTGVWKTMNISLMTGNNFKMVTLATIAIVDGTDSSKTNFSYTCPEVTPNSAIYFYQFSSSGSSNLFWTGRFTIKDPANDVVPPTNQTQPDGEKIPWGTGALVNASSSSAPSPSSAPTSSPSSTPSSVPPSSTTSTASTTVVLVTSDVSPTPSSVESVGTNSAAMLSVWDAFPAGLALWLAVGFATIF